MRSIFLPSQVKKIKDESLRDRGFSILKDLDIEEVEAAAEYCQKLSASHNWDDGKDSHVKSFLRQFLLDPNDERHLPVWKLASHPEIISRVVDYLGFVPLISTAQIWYSPNTEFVENRSQMFHLDGEDCRQVKLFLFLTDVDLNNGPLTVIPRKKSYEIYSDLKKRGVIYRRNQRIKDKDIENVASREDVLPLVGKAKTIGLVDTDSCYHYGSRPGDRPRLVLQIQYVGATSSHQPLFKRRLGAYYQEVFKKNHFNKALDRYLFGYQHLSFAKTRNQKA